MINMGLIEKCLAVFFVVFCFIAAVHFSSFHSLCTTTPPNLSFYHFNLHSQSACACQSFRSSLSSLLCFSAEVSVDSSHIFSQPFFFLRLLSLALSHIVPSLVPLSGPNQTTHHSQNSDFSQGHSTSSKTKKWIVSQYIATVQKYIYTIHSKNTYTVANDFICKYPPFPPLSSWEQNFN